MHINHYFTLDISTICPCISQPELAEPFAGFELSNESIHPISAMNNPLDIYLPFIH